MDVLIRCGRGAVSSDEIDAAERGTSEAASCRGAAFEPFEVYGLALMAPMPLRQS